MRRKDLIKKYHNELIKVTDSYKDKLDVYDQLTAIDIIRRRLERVCDALISEDK